MSIKPSERIVDIFGESYLNDLKTVASNICENHGVETALTYLLGAQDLASILDKKYALDVIKQVRETLKKEFRNVGY